MKKILLLTFLSLSFAVVAKAQKIDSIYFNLYTDSLKKGAVHFNYINIDGKLSNGRYIPLDTTKVKLTCSAGKLTGNVLQLDETVKDEYVVVTATLIENPSIRKEVNIYIKKVIVHEKLKTTEELLEEWNKKSKKKN